MRTHKLFATAMLAACGLAALVGTYALADASGSQSAGQPEMQLPPGWTAEDMQAMMAASTPGKMHEHLADGVGNWSGKCTMWMAPDTEPIVTQCTSVVSPLLDGRFTKCEMSGEMPGMGPFNGVGVFGFDNVAQKFQAIWISNHGTGMMVGEGELSPDGTTLTWEYKGTCPIAKGPITMRDVETITGPNSKTIESFGTDPKSGQEFKMMSLELTRD